MRLIAFLFCFYSFTSLYSQCTGNFQFPYNTISASTFDHEVVITPDHLPNNYALIDNLIPNQTYEIYSSIPGDYITIRDAYDFNILIAHGPAPFAFTPANLDKVSMHIHLSVPSCGTELIKRQTSIACITCPAEPTKIGINDSTPESVLDVDGEIKIGQSALNPVAGMMRWNDVNNDFEGYNGSQWLSLTQSNQSGQWGVLPVTNQNPNQRVVSNDGTSNDNFGKQVAISENYAVIGSHRSNIGGNPSQGAAYVFERIDNQWIFQTKLTASDGAIGDWFAVDVDIWGDHIIIGSSHATINGNDNQGATYVFYKNGNTWIEQAKLTADDGMTDYFFGETVAIDDDYIVVGSRFATVNGNDNQGAVYVFQRTGSTWNQVAKLIGNDGEEGDSFGYDIDIDGKYVAIGAPFKDINGNIAQGMVYIFRRTGLNWNQLSTILASDGDISDYFGECLHLHNDRLAIGAPYKDIGGNNNQGAVYFYHYTGGNWVEQNIITAPDGGPEHLFPSSIGLYNGTAILGTEYADFNNNTNQGKSYIYKYHNDTWKLETEILPPTVSNDMRFGSGVSIFGNNAIIGSQYEDEASNTKQGAAYFLIKK